MDLVSCELQKRGLQDIKPDGGGPPSLNKGHSVTRTNGQLKTNQT